MKKAPEGAPTQGKDNKNLFPSNTRGSAFAATKKLRASEAKILSAWFHEHPDACICTNDVVPILGKQINHCTRAIKDLLDAGIIEPVYSAVSIYSEIPVRHVRLARPKAQGKNVAIQLSLNIFDYGN